MFLWKFLESTNPYWSRERRDAGNCSNECPTLKALRAEKPEKSSCQESLACYASCPSPSDFPDINIY
ncbi:uncharacterized protein DS421_18g606940 [Arachis hypogaea]|nr:uncharacterized protein DS421_18g606940 [Arachis hypogaea]